MDIFLKERLRDYNYKNPDNKKTQAELAEEIGVTVQTLINLKKRTPEPVETLDKICNVLGFTYEQMKVEKLDFK